MWVRELSLFTKVKIAMLPTAKTGGRLGRRCTQARAKVDNMTKHFFSKKFAEQNSHVRFQVQPDQLTSRLSGAGIEDF
jgi:hypothetical protein